MGAVGEGSSVCGKICIKVNDGVSPEAGQRCREEAPEQCGVRSVISMVAFLAGW